MTKIEFLASIARFVEERPGLPSVNYAGAPNAYRADRASIARALADCRALLASIARNPAISAKDIEEGLNASSRLWIVGREIDYHAGQYRPTEYRRAMASCLAHVVGVAWTREAGEEGPRSYDRARAEFGRSLASRWFRPL